uniref:Hydantoin permease n=1 Tax=Microbacterium maritypicum TaxID=33918 RepID=HYUP_MICMQ|nr:RecName: Full=Hydantoin permease; Short=MHP; AltName: Full=Hydantoin transport protein; AltName: Full=NCS1 benzyl-hydantoin transporter; AltName: Full=Nucleobase cation symporter 1; Short=NCS1; AltName: Full=Sodium-coupled secondary active transport protein; AltName: Full=Sodium-hydantoin transporter Mhp1 [Microbacterium liquefaciens]
MNSTPIEEARSLLNPSNAPTRYAERSVGPFSLAAIWFAMAIQVAIFIAAGQMTSSFQVWQVIVAIAAGCTIAVILLFFTQSAAIRWGINFTVAARMPFGIRGSLIPITLKALLSLFWFGFQTWLGALALDEITRLLTGFTNLPLWIVIFGAIQVVTTFYGITFIRWMNVFASPVLLAMGVYMVYLMLDGADVSLGEVMSMGGENPGMPFSTAIMIFVGGWIAVVVSIHDIVKECKVDPNASREGQTKADARYATAQWLGMVPASIIFGFIGAASMVLVGEWNPVIAITEVVGGVSIPMAILFQVFVLLATWSTNPAANLLSPAYTLCSTFPRVFTFKTGVIVSAVVGLLMMPWQFAGVLNTFLNLLASALGPLAGIMISDYFLVRRRRISLHDLYRTKGIYTYWRGVNWVALAVYAVALAVSFLTPDLMFVTGLIAALLLHIPAMRWVAKTFPLFSEAESRNEDYLRPIGPVAPADESATANTKEQNQR